MCQPLLNHIKQKGAIEISPYTKLRYKMYNNQSNHKGKFMIKNTLSFTKLATVALTLGFISPAISVDKNYELSLFNTVQADNINQNRNRNRNKNVNVNRNVNKNTNVNNNNRRGVRPLGVLAGMAIGATVVASAMSPSCTTVRVNGNVYKKCDGTYFQASGSNYVVVKSPY